MQVQVLTQVLIQRLRFVSQENSLLPKGGQISMWPDISSWKKISLFDNFHCKYPQPQQLVAGSIQNNHSLILFFTIFDTQGCYKTCLLNKKVRNLALKMWFWDVFLSFNSTTRPALVVKIHFKSSKYLLDMRNYPLNPFSSIFDTPGNSKIPSTRVCYCCMYNIAKLVFFHAQISFPEQFY